MTSNASPVIPTCWPKFLTAGATFKVDRSWCDYSTSDWSLSIFFAGARTGAFTTTPQITPDPAGTVWHVLLAPTDTAPLNPSGGQSLPYTAIERLTNAGTGEVRDIDAHRVMVVPNIATAIAGDFVTFEENCLVQVRAAIAARLAGGLIVESYSIAGRSITKLSMRDLQEWEGTLKAKIYRQRNPGRVGVPGTFSLPSTAYTPWPWRGRWSE
jgi:hypothetical protein